MADNESRVTEHHVTEHHVTDRRANRQQHWWQLFFVIGTILAGFALRAYQLDGQSLWSDEGISLVRSQRPLSFMLESMPVEQMPGYFVILHGWLPLAGTTDFAMRFLSLWPSVLTIALLYRLGQDLGSRWLGFLAAVLVATNPFQIWYAQEARTYSWLLLLGLLANWLFWRLLTQRSVVGARGWLTVIAYGTATAGTVYLHYYGALVPLAHLCVALGWLLYRRDWAFFWRWVGGGLVSLLLFAPWAPRTLGIFTFPGWREAIDPWQIPGEVLTLYTVGETLPASWQDWLPWLYLGLLLLGCIGWWRVGRKAFFFLLAVVFVPLGVTFGVALQTLDYHERYTMVATAPLLLLVAGGLGGFMRPHRSTAQPQRWRQWTSRGMGVVLLLPLLAANRAALHEQYTNDAYHKPDFRAAVEMIERFGQPGDVVILDGPDPNLVFLHYYRAPYPIHDMRDYLDESPEAVAAAVAAKTADAKRAWEVLLFHEPWAVQQWLGRNYWTVPTRDYNSIRVTLYGLSADIMVTTAADLQVGEALQLVQSALPGAALQPGDLLQVTTTWQVLQPAPDYKFSLRLLNGAGEAIETQDYVPQNWFFPTSQWPVGEQTNDRRGFLLAHDLAAGHYQVTLRLYDPNTGAVAETAQGQDIALGTVEVLQRAP